MVAVPRHLGDVNADDGPYEIDVGTVYVPIGMEDKQRVRVDQVLPDEERVVVTIAAPPASGEGRWTTRQAAWPAWYLDPKRELYEVAR